MFNVVNRFPFIYFLFLLFILIINVENNTIFISNISMTFVNVPYLLFYSCSLKVKKNVLCDDFKTLQEILYLGLVFKCFSFTK